MLGMRKILIFIILSGFIFSNNLLNYNAIYHKELNRLSKKMEREEKNIEQLEIYLSKPIELEWHVIFSGFHEEHGNGRDNTKENAKYYSKINGYNDINEVININSLSGNSYKSFSIKNDIIIKTTGVLALDGIQITVRPDLATKQPSSNPNYESELSGISIVADEILLSKPIVILPGFADGTISDFYKLEGIILATSGKYDFISGSLLWEATPKATLYGADIYMSRKAFTDFTDGLWFEELGTALENNYLSATGNGVKIYNKTAYIPNEINFRHVIASLAGNVYANINQREADIASIFSNSYDLLQNFKNNTRENYKINIILGKGKNKEKTDGVAGYDYAATGILSLREVEYSHKHIFGYSLGYLHTGFEFKDGNESEEWVDTIQLGMHNKYKTNGWQLRNDLTGRASIHNVDRNIDWPSPLGRSEMNGTYET